MRFKLVALLLVILGIVSCSKSWEPEIHYIPENVVGEIIWIKFDQPDGEERQYKNGKRFYKIPRSGSLKTKFKVNTGWIDNAEVNEFYLVDRDDKILEKLNWNYWGNKEFYTENKNEIGIVINRVAGSDFYFNAYVVDTIDINLIIRKDYNDRISRMEGLRD